MNPDHVENLARHIYESLTDEYSPFQAWADAHPDDRHWWRKVAELAIEYEQP